MNKLFLWFAIMATVIGFACPAYAAPVSPKVSEPINHTTSQPIGGMDDDRNPVTLRLDAATGALLTMTSSGTSGGSSVSILLDGTIVSSSNPLPVSGSLTLVSSDNTTFRDDGTATKVVVSAAAGNLISATCYNISTGLKYLQIFDTATAPTAGAVPKLSFLCAKNAQIYVGNDVFGKDGLTMAIGIGMAISTTYETFTDAAVANEQFMQAVYK